MSTTIGPIPLQYYDGNSQDNHFKQIPVSDGEILVTNGKKPFLKPSGKKVSDFVASTDLSNTIDTAVADAITADETLVKIANLADNFASTVNGLTPVSSIANTDIVVFIDKSTGAVTGAIAFSDLKAVLKTYFDTIYSPIS